MEICQGSGRWLSHLILDGKVVWRIEDQVPQYQLRGDKMLDGSVILDSDMEKREDIALMYDKKWIEAEVMRNKFSE